MKIGRFEEIKARVRNYLVLWILAGIYIINSLVCLSVCPPPYGRLNGWADFKNILHVDYPWVGDGLGKKKI